MRRTLAITALAAAIAAGLAVPAHAQTISVPDGRDTDAVQELVGVRIKHEKLVTVVMRFSSNYHRGAEYPFSIWYDTRRSDRGPEFAYFSHFGAVYKVESWRGGLAHEMDCFVDGKMNLRKHTIRITVGHGCLGGDRGPVRVNVSASGQAEDLSFVPDYAPGFHEFSEPVARG
jgi:hypothetical protein